MTTTAALPTSLEFLLEQDEISMRTYNTLRRASYASNGFGEIHGLEDLAGRKAEDLLKFRNFGQRTLLEIEIALKKRDLAPIIPVAPRTKKYKKAKPRENDVLVDELMLKVMQSHIETALYRCNLKVTPNNVDKVASSTITEDVADNFQKVITGALTKVILERADELGLEWEHELLPVSSHK